MTESSIRESSTFAVECFLEGASFGLPSLEVDRVIEYEVSTLPLAGPTVVGIGVHDDDLVVLVRVPSPVFSTPEPVVGFRRARGALLVRTAPAGIRLAIEVGEVRSILRLFDGPFSRTWPHWLVPAWTEDGREVPRMDVDRFLATL